MVEEDKTSPEGENSPDIFRSLSGQAAAALFLPSVSAEVIREGATRIDLSEELDLRRWRFSPNLGSLFERLSTKFRLEKAADSQNFHLALQKLFEDKKQIGDPLREAYQEAVNRDDEIGPFREESLLQIQRTLQQWLIEKFSEEYEGRTSYGRAKPDEVQHMYMRNLKRIPQEGPKTTHTGLYNSVLVTPASIFSHSAAELFDDVLREWPNKALRYVTNHPDYQTLGQNVLDHVAHPDLAQVDLETQRRLAELSNQITRDFPFGQIQSIAASIGTAVNLPPSEVAKKAAEGVLDLEYLLRSADFWQRWHERNLPMCSPTIAAGLPRIEINNGICPSLALLPENKRPHIIVPQTIRLDDNNPILVFAGSSDAGKSTTLRQAGQTLVQALQGHYVATESCTLSPFADLIVGLHVARDPAMGSSHRQEMHFLKEKLFDPIASKKPRVALLDDLLQRTSSKDGEALLRATLKYLQENGVLTLVATHLNSATKHFAQDGLRAKVYSLDLETHQMKEGVEKSGAIEIAEKAGLEKEIIDIARQLQQQEDQASIHLELPPLPEAKEKLSVPYEFQTDEATLRDLNLIEGGLRLPILDLLYDIQTPYYLEKRYETFIDRATRRAFINLFSGAISEEARRQRLETIGTLISNTGQVKLDDLADCLYSLTRLGKDEYSHSDLTSPLGLQLKSYFLRSKDKLTDYDLDEHISYPELPVFKDFFDRTSQLEKLSADILADGKISGLHASARNINKFLRSRTVKEWQTIASKHPEVSSHLFGQKRYERDWKRQWVDFCRKHNAAIEEFVGSIANIGAYVSLVRTIEGMPVVPAEEGLAHPEKLVEKGLNPFLLFSTIARLEKTYEWRKNLTERLKGIMGDLRYETYASPNQLWSDVLRKVEVHYPDIPKRSDILSQRNYFEVEKKYTERERKLGLTRDEYRARLSNNYEMVQQGRDYDQNGIPFPELYKQFLREHCSTPELIEETLEKIIGFSPPPQEEFFNSLIARYPILSKLSRDDLSIFLEGDMPQEKFRVAYFELLGKLYPELANLKLEDLPQYLGYARTPEERMVKFLGLMKERYPYLANMELVDTPEFIEEAPVVIFTGPNDGGKTQFLFKDAYDVLWGEQIGRVFGTKGYRQRSRFLLTALYSGYDTETQGSLHSEFANRIQPLIDRYKRLGEPTGGVISIDEPISPWTSHEEAKYLIAAYLKYFARRGVKVRITTHCMEALDLLKKLDEDSKVDYMTVSTTSPLGEEKYQIEKGTGESHGIDIAEAEGWPKEVVQKAREIRKSL